MKLALKISGAVVLALGLFYGYGAWYYYSLSNTEKCTLVGQIQILKQSPFDAKFYEPQPHLERFCSAINKGR